MRREVNASIATRLVVMDGNTPSVPGGRCVAFWRSLDVPSGAVSVPGLVEQSATGLRDEYTRWVHDLGATRVRGRSVRSHLAFWPDFSFWWMTLIAEKGPLKSDAIHRVFKMRALEQLHTRRDCHGILYVGNDLAVHRTLRNWARALDEPYERRRAATPRETVPFRRRLPFLVQAAGYLAAKWWSRYRIARRRRSAIEGLASKLTAITYFPNVDLERTSRGRFWSRYWEALHDLFDEVPNPVVWLWLYVDSEQIPYRDAVSLRDRCNRAAPAKYRHVLIDEFGSAAVILRALVTFAKSCAAAVWLRGIARSFHFPESAVNFFPLMSHDWRSSLCGITAIDGALNIALFDAAARSLGTSALTLYIWENQSWEHAAIAAWRRAANGRLIGVQHATLPPLDLRAAIDPRETEAPGNERRPLPDCIAVNGNGARAFLSSVGLPAERLIVTEALRYGYLAATPTAAEGMPQTLLVATGFRRAEARRQLALLNSAASLGALVGYTRVIVKPHPLCAVEPLIADVGLIWPHEIVKQPLASMWPVATTAFVANSTSAVAEALSLRIPTAVCAPDDGMNLSPAFGVPGVPMVATGEALAAFLRAPSAAAWPVDYLVIDPRLPRWRALLSV
jgi:surface carbohydrate biosynthesis protein (TIGR04326 family)